jgi:uncharacterized membrane protein
MFFAHMALRPSLGLLEPPARLALMAATLGRFFAWIVGAVAAILVTGAALMPAANAAGGARHAMAMAAIGVAMALVFGYIRWRPYPRLAAAVARRAWPEAGLALGVIRRLVAFNLALGLVTFAVAIVGPAIN